MEHWTNQSLSRLGPRPKAGRFISQRLLCMCLKIHCLNVMNDGGCFKCELTYENSKDDSTAKRLFFDSDKNVHALCAIANNMWSTTAKTRSAL